jgi:hypothetical protein
MLGPLLLPRAKATWESARQAGEGERRHGAPGAIPGPGAQSAGEQSAAFQAEAKACKIAPSGPDVTNCGHDFEDSPAKCDIMACKTAASCLGWCRRDTALWSLSLLAQAAPAASRVARQGALVVTRGATRQAIVGIKFAE